MISVTLVFLSIILIVHLFIWYDQDDTLTGNLASVDISTKENLQGLIKVGEELLDKPTSKINLDKGVYEAVENGGTNKEALRRYMIIVYRIF